MPRYAILDPSRVTPAGVAAIPPEILPITDGAAEARPSPGA
jgi:hypothetical protein